MMRKRFQGTKKTCPLQLKGSEGLRNVRQMTAATFQYIRDLNAIRGRLVRDPARPASMNPVGLSAWFPP